MHVTQAKPGYANSTTLRNIHLFTLEIKDDRHCFPPQNDKRSHGFPKPDCQNVAFFPTKRTICYFFIMAKKAALR